MSPILPTATDVVRLVYEASLERFLRDGSGFSPEAIKEAKNG